MQQPFRTAILVFGLAVSLLLQTAMAEDGKQPLISIIIDDIGYRLHEDLRAIGLPGQVAYAIMPHSPHARKMSALANSLGKDVLVHMPMQATEDEKNEFLGPGALTLQMTREEFDRTLELGLRSIPHAIGVNNHMGSLLTRHPGHMEWLMESLKIHRKFYIDSVTSNQSVAASIAREVKLPYLSRDVFLDNVQSDKAIQKQFDELVKIARKKGVAIAIGHPHPETLTVLSRNLLLLDTTGVKLISPKQMLKLKTKPNYFKKVSLGH